MCGHSLGGGCATLLGVLLNDKADPLGYPNPNPNPDPNPDRNHGPNPNQADPNPNPNLRTLTLTLTRVYSSTPLAWQ